MEFPVEATGLRGANTTVPRGPREALETKTHSQTNFNHALVL